MSAAIVQRKSAFATVVGSGSVAVTLDNPISAGSIVVLAAALVQSNGSGAYAPVVSVADDKSNDYSPFGYVSSGSGYFANAYQGAINPATGAKTYTLNFTAPSGQSTYTFLVGLVAYELSGTAYAATAESASQSLTGFKEVPNLSAQISSLSGGTYGNFLCAIAALEFGSGDLTDAQQVGAGSGWNPDGADAINGAFSPMAICFESQFAGTSSNPAATFSGDANNTELDGTILIAAFSLTAAISGGGGSYSNDLPFLGSVTLVDEPPAGYTNPFLGTYKVLASVPPGFSEYPYLGRVYIGTPQGSQVNNNPHMGQIVILDSPRPGPFPANGDPFLGTIEEG
ncbi:MAG: hypothetical protein WA817_23860 [Candidatus Acidiferrum sp.]